MKKTLCPICSTARGRRACMINNNTLICPACCAKTRNNLCEGCDFYSQAEKYKTDRLEKEEREKEKEKEPTYLREISQDADEGVELALELAHNGDFRKAEKNLMVLQKKYPLVESVYFGLGVVCVMNDQEDKAIQHFKKAIELNPYSVEAWYNLGTIYKNKLEIDFMIEAYRKVVKYGNISEPFVRNANEILADLEAQIQMDKNMTLDEYQISMAIFKDAFSAMQKNDWDKAIASFRKVLTFDAEHIQSYGNMGICYAQQGKKQEALALLDKALELDPKYEPAIMNRKIVAALKEGEKLSDKVADIEYYKERAMKEKR